MMGIFWEVEETGSNDPNFDLNIDFRFKILQVMPQALQGVEIVGVKEMLTCVRWRFVHGPIETPG